jgi:hypothetical protein
MDERATCHDHDQYYWVDEGCPVCVLSAALSEAQATIARLKDFLREAKNELERGWGTEDLTMACYREFESVMAQIDAELSPREGEGE